MEADLTDPRLTCQTDHCRRRRPPIRPRRWPIGEPAPAISRWAPVAITRWDIS